MVKVGLDLGYANITLSDATSGVLREPSVALVEKNTRRILSVGEAATSTSDAGEDAILIRPFKNGMLYSSDLTGSIINGTVKALNTNDKITCVVGIPDDFIPKQTSELFEKLEAAGVSSRFAVKRAVAALIGAGYAPTISAVSVNIGASRTEIAVLDHGEIIYSASEPVGGEEFDKAVKQFIAEQGDFNVSLIVARAIKERLGAVWEGKPSESIEIEGTLSLTGKKVSLSLATEDIIDVFHAPLRAEINAVAQAVKKIPIDRVSEIFENGIILSGGGAELFGIDKMMERVLGVKVTLAQEPIDCVAKGLSRVAAFLPAKAKCDHDVTDLLAKYYRDSKK